MRVWRCHLLDGRIRQNLPKYPGVEARWPGRHTWRCTWQRAPPHILTTYICQLSQLQAPSQHRQHRQPGAGSPLSQSTNIVIYLSSSRQSPASGAAALGHSHTFTSPSLAQLCPWPSQQLSDCMQYICTKNISYTHSVQNIKFLCYTINTNLWHSPKYLIIICNTPPSSGNKASWCLLCLVIMSNVVESGRVF